MREEKNIEGSNGKKRKDSREGEISRGKERKREGEERKEGGGKKGT